jgi:hypothetical protein
MNRLRTRWLAIIGGALLLVLSASAALGSDPASLDAKRGPTIAQLVQDLLAGNETEEEEDPSAEPSCDPLTGPDTCEPADECDVEPVPDGCDPEAEESEEAEEADADGSAEDGTHGACVSEVARDKDAVGGENDNHGGAVSEAARETCRDDASEESEAEAETEAEESGEKADRQEREGRGKPPWAGNGGRRGGGRP